MEATTHRATIAPLRDEANEFEILEHRMISAQTIELTGSATASGGFNADVQFQLKASRSGQAEFSVQGTFGETPLDHTFLSDGITQCVVGNDESRRNTQVKLWDAFILGFTRQGIMHHVSRLSEGRGPDFADDGPQTRLSAEQFAHLDDIGGIAIRVSVDGEQVAMASLVFDDERPRRREQRVQFEGSSMVVAEDYEVFLVDSKLALDSSCD